MNNSTLLQHIHQARHQLRKSERKVCEYVLSHLNDVIHMRIVDLASAADVSEPTVVRFCRAIDCTGFQDFKLRLAQYLATKKEFETFVIADTDSVADLGVKVFDATLATLTQVRDAINPDAIEAAIEAITQAKRVEFYGFGASAAVAADAQHKFFRLQISTSAYSDPHIQTMSAMSLSTNDVVVAISQSGKTRALIEAIKLANNAGAKTIALAPTDSPTSLPTLPLPTSDPTTSPPTLDPTDRPTNTPTISRFPTISPSSISVWGVPMRPRSWIY